VLLLLVKNPAGANEVVRTLVDAGAPGRLLIALNDDIADGRDVSWIWDVDFEPLIGSLRELIVSGARAEELALRFKYGGLEPDRIMLVRDLGDALSHGVDATPTGGELVVLPTYTAMLALRQIASEQGLVRPYWEEAVA
jgi:UDP-N-acetylmuramyl tripeptide synthase